MNKRSFPATVGASSLLVIFAVLCLTVFALLSLSTAQADRRLSDASVDAALAYYEADTEAEKIFARLRGGEVPEGVRVSAFTGPAEGVSAAGALYSYTCAISGTQTLYVELCEQDGQWTVLRWQAVSTAAWEENDSIGVWDGDSDF